MRKEIYTGPYFGTDQTIAAGGSLDRKTPPTPDRPRFTLADIRNQLEHGSVVSVAGELSVLHPGHNGFYPRRDFYVEPLVPPQIPVLTDRQVDALNAAAYFKKQPTRGLSAIPRHFADEYNRILRDMLPPDKFPGYTTRFGFVSNLDSSRVNFGRREYSFPGESVQVTQRTEVEVQNPELRRQLAMVQGEIHTSTVMHPTGVRVRLFPPGLAKRIYDYEKGYYVDGNVEEWRELVYKNRYISDDAVSPEQLQAMARGEKPWPEVVYLPESEFKGSPEQIMDMLSKRAIGRETRDDDVMFGVGMPEIDDPTPEHRQFLANMKREAEELGISRKYGEGDFDEDHPLMAQFASRVGDPQNPHTH